MQLTNRIIFFLVAVLSNYLSLAQDIGTDLGRLSGSSEHSRKIHYAPFFSPVDSNVSAHKRKWLVAGSHIALYGGSLVVLNEAWYKGYPKQKLASFDDSKEWLQVDKIGHAWSAYGLSRASAQSWRWTGMNEKKADLLGAASGFGFLTVIEILDGRSAQWGFSWSDIAANTFGTGLFLGQQLTWQEQRVALKYSFHRNKLSDPVLSARSRDLFGSSWYEGMLKDYNSQTYWLSTNLKSFFKQAHLPSWFNIAVGYGASGMYGGFENIARDENGNITFDRRDITRKRQFYLAPDIDFTRIKTNKKWLKKLFFVLQGFKFPAPTLMLDSKGKIKGYFVYF